MIVERDGMILIDYTVKPSNTATNETLDKMVERIINQRVRKMTNEKLEELERTERILKHLLKTYSAELPPDFILQFRQQIKTISDHIEWINKELES